MNWNGVLVLLLAFMMAQAVDQENEEPDSTTTTNVSTEFPQSSPENQIQLDSKLRAALLKALKELENEEDKTIQNDDYSEDSEKSVERAQASSITIFADEDNVPKLVSSENKSEGKEETYKSVESTEKPEEDPSKQKAEEVIFQKSESAQGQTITSREKSPLDPLKDAEQIITSASNSFVSTNDDHTRSIANNSITKISSFTNLNAISDNESKKFSSSKSIDGSDLVKTYIKPVKSSEAAASDVDQIIEAKTETNIEITNAATEKPIEVSTEESEAKVEQVQFFSAPLVAAFTVHQDETGQPKKVEPIYKNTFSSSREENELAPLEPQPTNIPQLKQTPTTFSNLNIQQKQKILEQELEKLRSQQQNLFARNTQYFNNIDSINQPLSQSGFKQAINQNFNQFDPVFTEPDRSIVTKLATIDPSNLFVENSGLVLNKFTSKEAILPEPKSAPLQSSKTGGDVSLVPSISFDPLLEAGKLPKNAQILPTKGPTGFHSFVKLAKPQSQNFVASSFNLAPPSPSFTDSKSNSNEVFREQQNVFNPGGSNFVGQSNLNNNNNFFNNQPNRFLGQETTTVFPDQNRILRQEQGANNLGFDKNAFSIVPAQQPFAPTHELGYFPDSRQNNGVLIQPPQVPTVQNYNNRFLTNNNVQGQNQNRLIRPYLQNINIQQSIQPFGIQPLSISSQGNRFFSSGQEGKVGNALSSSVNEPQNNRILRSNPESNYLSNQKTFFQRPILQNYKYSNSFGFAGLPFIG